MSQEGESRFQKMFHVNELEKFSRKSGRGECSWFDNRRGNDLTIDHYNRLAMGTMRKASDRRSSSSKHSDQGGLSIFSG